MDGLKAKEVTLCSAIEANSYFRLEAEYFLASQFLFNNVLSGAELAQNIQYGTSNALNDDAQGYPVLRLNEFDDMFIKNPSKYCDTLSFNEYNVLQLKKGDVLICRTNGNPDLVGRAAVIMDDFPYAFASYLFKVRTNENILPETLVAFLNGKFGRMEIDKNSMKGNQTNFSPAKFRDIIVPLFWNGFQQKIKEHFFIAYNLRKNAITLYADAEKVLLKELNIPHIQKEAISSSIKRLSDSFLMLGRLDAEYYQSKYEEIRNNLKKSQPLYKICNLYDGDYAPISKVSYPYIELSNVGVIGDIIGVEKQFGESLPTRARRQVKTGQVIISSVEGSLPSCALITEKYNQAICSTGFYVIDSKSINPETLLVLFKSPPMQAMLKQHCSGTILTAVTKDEFLNIPIPHVEIEIQHEVRDLIQESFILREQSETLLEQAKRAVEIAVEQNENAAITFLRHTKGGVR